MKRLKILFEASPVVDTKKTGVGHYVELVVKAIAANGSAQVNGFYFNFLGLNKNYLPDIAGVKFKRIWFMPGKILSVCRRLGFQPFFELFTLKSADILFFTNYVTLPTMRKSKKALAIYDLGFLDHPDYMQRINLAYLKKFCPPSIKRADIIVTISEFTKQRIEHWFPDLKAPIVVTPIPPTTINAKNVELDNPLKQLGVKPKKYILYLGTIEPRKNIENLVKAYALLPVNIRQEYSLVLSGGKGWKDEAIRAEIAKQQENGINIITTGYVTDHEKSALYSQCICFVMPSHYEGFGMPVMEAMQYDIPTAVSDIPVFHEAAGDAALYFNQNDIKDISKKINQLISDDNLRENIVTSGKKQLLKFSWEENAVKIMDAFDEIVSKK